MNPPATKQQLENLAALYGCRLEGPDFSEHWNMRLPTMVGCIHFSIYTPIEVWIERLARWRREDI